MQAGSFLQLQTLMILMLGLVAFVLDTVFGVLFAKLLSLLTRGKINPLVGAAGRVWIRCPPESKISAVRVVGLRSAIV